MPIYLITGQPGNGKTLCAMHFLTEYLTVTPESFVVTNIHLYDGRLAAYMRARGVVNLWDRLEKLTHEKTINFYETADEREFRLDSLGNVVPVRIRRPIVFVIDEAHLYWNARNFAKTTIALLSYISQHRHLGDTIVLITQHPEMLEKAFRRLVDEYWLMTNMAKRRVFGFRGPEGWFKKAVYFKPPGLLDRPAETKRFKIDMELASCYDTAAGKQFGTTVADTKQKKQGIPFWVGASVALLVLLLVLRGVQMLPWMVGKAIQTVTGGMDAVGTNVANLANASTDTLAESVGLSLANHPETTQKTQPIELVEVKVPVAYSGYERGPDGKTIRVSGIRDITVLTNAAMLPKPSLDTQQPARTQVLHTTAGPIANPGPSGPAFRSVRLRMWDGTTKVIRIYANTRNTAPGLFDREGTPDNSGGNQAPGDWGNDGVQSGVGDEGLPGYAPAYPTNGDF